MPLRNGVQFKTYRLCISGLFHSIFRLRLASGNSAYRKQN